MSLLQRNKQEDVHPSITGRKVLRADILREWIKMEQDDSDISTVFDTMKALPSSFKGSRFGHDSLRIMGSKNFIKSIMALLTPLTKLENDHRRLEIIMRELDNNCIQPPYNKDKSHWVLYVRLIRREISLNTTQL